jgi:hypothetical protein
MHAWIELFFTSFNLFKWIQKLDLVTLFCKTFVEFNSTSFDCRISFAMSSSELYDCTGEERIFVGIVHFKIYRLRLCRWHYSVLGDPFG